MSVLYGVSVGPGDPSLMTLKSVEIINSVDVVAFPNDVEKSISYNIAKKVCNKINEKELLSINMPMTKDEEILKKAHFTACATLKKYLDDEKDVAFLVIGDVSIYSTFIYIYKQLINEGYTCKLIPGVSSITSAACSVGIDLCSGDESLHILPACYNHENMLSLPGTKVFMKMGKRLDKIIKHIKEKKCKNAYMIYKSSTREEEVYLDIDKFDYNKGYMSIIIVKDENE